MYTDIPKEKMDAMWTEIQSMLKEAEQTDVRDKEHQIALMDLTRDEVLLEIEYKRRGWPIPAYRLLN